MLMEFKAGDRVHVLRYNGEDVDFYGTLKYVDKCMANLFDCTIKRNEGVAVFLPSDNSFGEDKEDYFVLEEDEEDTKGGNNLPTIKRKVEMNLPQLIEWAWDNNIKNERYRCSDIIPYEYVWINENYDVELDDNMRISKNDTFTVEVVEEITEDTVFDNLIEINELIDFKKEGLLGGVRLYKNSSINQVENDKSVAYYIMNDDLEMTLIWKRKEGLVEYMVTIKHTRESIAELEQEREQFKQQRDSLIKDMEKLREEKAAIEMYLDAVKVYKPMYECVNDKYKYLTSYIKNKALHNPSVSRYINLVHVIDELERERD